ncbi:MAG: hypothetical protein AB7P04_01055 [Bacteriovoracia bacterium]
MRKIDHRTIDRRVLCGVFVVAAVTVASARAASDQEGAIQFLGDEPATFIPAPAASSAPDSRPAPVTPANVVTGTLQAPAANALVTPPLESEENPSGELGVQSTVEVSSTPLTTETVWRLEPREINPHRRRWAIERSLEVLRLEAAPIGATAAGDSSEVKFGVRSHGLVAQTVIHLRGEGPSYQSPDRFPCGKRQSWFSTREGTRAAADFAVKDWLAWVEKKKPALANQLDRVSEKSAELAREQGKRVFERWIQALDRDWSVGIHSRAQREEFAFYERAAKAASQKSGACLNNVAWESLMEPTTGVTPEKPLARMPARRWNGYYSVRLTLEIGLKKFTGQFLIDTGTEKNLISPEFFEAQGVFASLLEIKDRAPEDIRWLGGTALARPIILPGVRASGQSLPLREWWMTKTDLFGPPKNFARCCDGVLGREFLRHYAVEFSPEAPVHVKLWQRDGFHRGSQPWVEVALTDDGRMVSACQAVGKHQRLTGVEWDTGRDAALTIHSPWRSAIGGQKDWDLFCGARKIAARAPAGFSSELTSKLPAATVGLDLLDRGGYTLDLSHGRIWFPDQALGQSVAANRTGLVLDFVWQKDGERVLKVVGIQPGTPADELRKRGLRRDLVISEINGQPSEDLDLWEVERYLAGSRGDELSLKWVSGKTVQSGSIRVQ